MKKGKIITVSNEKGGVGKTSIVKHLSYSLANNGYKVLCIDMDTQASLTKSLFITRERHTDTEFEYNKTFMSGIVEGDLEKLVINVIPNLDFIPSDYDFVEFSTFLNKKFGLVGRSDSNYIEVKLNQYNYIKNILEPFKSKYDFIFIDTPPTASDITYAGAYVCDYVIIALQTQSDSLDGAINYVEQTLDFIVNKLGANLEVVGILPNQLSKKGSIDIQVINDVINYFGKENVFNNIIPYTKAIQTVARKGLNKEDYWDKKMFDEVFEPIAKEFLSRIELLEESRGE